MLTVMMLLTRTQYTPSNNGYNVNSCNGTGQAGQWNRAALPSLRHHWMLLTSVQLKPEFPRLKAHTSVMNFLSQEFAWLHIFFAGFNVHSSANLAIFSVDTNWNSEQVFLQYIKVNDMPEHWTKLTLNQLYTVSQKVAHHTLWDIFAQGWPIAKISTATESEIICEHKCVINVLIFNVPKCCHLAN